MGMALTSGTERSGRAWSCLAFAAVLVVCGAARASQDDARADFERATEALRTGDFPEARDLLRRVLEREPSTAAAFNLAVALRGTGQSVEAVEVLDALLDGRYGTLEANRRRSARSLRHQIEEDVARIRVRVRGAPEVDVRVDGERGATMNDGGTFERRVNAGNHVITAHARGYATVERQVEVPQGGEAELELTMQAAESVARGMLDVRAGDALEVEVVGVGRDADHVRAQLPVGQYTVRFIAPDGHRESRVAVLPGTEVSLSAESMDRPVRRNPWLWVGVIGALAVGAAVAAGVLLRDDGTGLERNPAVGGVIETLRGTP